MYIWGVFFPYSLQQKEVPVTHNSIFYGVKCKYFVMSDTITYLVTFRNS